MLYASDDFMTTDVKSNKRNKKQSKSSRLYEVKYVQDGFTNFYEVHAKNSGEATRKVKSMFGKIKVESTNVIN